MGDINISVTVVDNSDLVRKALPEDIDRALYAMGIKGVEGSVDAISGKYNINSAVDTGRLRASISFITASGDKGDSGLVVPNSKAGDKLLGHAEENTVIIGTNVNYAEYVHNGTSRMLGRPFLREGIDQTKADMKRQVEKILKGEL